MQVRATLSSLKAEFQTRYGMDHPAKTDEELIASLNCLRWLFDVSWDEATGV
jgi:hypothetical protein